MKIRQLYQITHACDHDENPLFSVQHEN